MRFFSLILIILLVGVTACATETVDESTPTPSVTPAMTPGVTVSLGAPAETAAGSYFVATVNINQVTDFAVFQFDIAYDSSVIAVIGDQGDPQAVTPGVIGDTAIPVEWVFSPPDTQGRIRVIGDAFDAGGVSGSGYMAQVHFRVTGSPGMSSEVTLSNVLLTDTMANEIALGGVGDAIVHVTQ